MTQRRITDDLQALMDVLPEALGAAVLAADNKENLLEIVLDLGRRPMARFVDGDVVLLDKEVDRAEIDYIVTHIGDIDADNRAGLERTLHRISAIRNRRGHIVGLTCRVGRAVYGTIDIIEDLVTSGKSILLLGKPGIGKTTMLREAARILAENKRVIIVDTSNEIGGDGDVPHPAVGRARRMQVSKPTLQHEVMIEAVENHNPEVIVIDEIGRELEADAARTIAERGVQLVATAHGRTLENLLLNPTLSDLIGGIESVTLSDEEARRRGTQKTVLERRSPPTFDVLIEIQDRDRLAVHVDVSAAVDALVRGSPLMPEIRYRSQDGELHVEHPAPPPVTRGPATATRRSYGVGTEAPVNGRRSPMPRTPVRQQPLGLTAGQESEDGDDDDRRGLLNPIRIFPYGVARNRMTQAAKRLGVPVIVAKNLLEADSLMTLRAYYRTRQQTIIEAEERALPIYVLRANTVSQIEQSLVEIFNLPEESPMEGDLDAVIRQTQQAINSVLNGQRYIEMPPASAYVRRVQHEMARQAQLISHSYGKDPNRRVRIFKE
jgi:stage III sporulation protein SpoIIIAA